jgi:fructose/tagatose bisphosphate aldolase
MLLLAGTPSRRLAATSCRRHCSRRPTPQVSGAVYSRITLATSSFMERALRLGCGALMADGSRLLLDENRELVARSVALASGYGAHVEAELGHVAGGDGVAEWPQPGQLTDPPDEAARLAADTGAACLDVSVGNVHGAYAQPPQLNWARLEAVRAATPVPLALHGASGIPDEDLRQAIPIGVAKVNVNTELRETCLAATERHMHEALNGFRL